MLFIRKFFAVLIIIVFIPLVLINIIFFSLKTTLLNPLYIQDIFNKNQIYSKIIDSAVPLLTQTMTKGEQLDQNVQIDDLATIVKWSIKPNWLQTQFDKIFEQFDKYLNGQSNDLNIVIDLKDLKDSFSTSLSQFSQQGLANLPDCTQEEFDNMDQNNRTLSCIPPMFSRDEMIKVTQEMFSGPQSDEILKQIPDQYDLGQIIRQTQGPQLETARTFFSYFKLGLLALTGINILLLILIGLLIWKPVNSLLKWLATAIIIPSIILLILSSFGYFFSPLVGGLGLTLPSELKSLVSTIIISLIQPAVLKILIISGFGTLLAIISYIIAHIFGKKHQINK